MGMVDHLYDKTLAMVFQIFNNYFYLLCAIFLNNFNYLNTHYFGKSSTIKYAEI